MKKLLPICLTAIIFSGNILAQSGTSTVKQSPDSTISSENEMTETTTTSKKKKSTKDSSEQADIQKMEDSSKPSTELDGQSNQGTKNPSTP